MSDLDDEELEATRRLNGVAKESDIEEDIKFIEEMAKEYKTFRDLHNPDFEDTDRIYKALENMLKKIQELEEHQKKFYSGELYTAKQLKQIEENQNKYFINKQKVKDKIEELKEVRKIALERKMMSSVESFEITIGHLEELLEEK